MSSYRNTTVYNFQPPTPIVIVSSTMHIVTDGRTYRRQYDANDWSYSVWGSSSSLLLSCTCTIIVCTVQHRRISPMTSSSRRLISMPGDAFGLLPHCRWMSVVHGCPPSAIGPSLLLLPVLGKSAATCHVRTLYVCFRDRLKAFLIMRSFLWILRFYRIFCSPCALTVVVSDPF